MSFASEILADSPAVFLQFDDASGSTTAVDSSVNARNFAVLNVTFQQPSLLGDGSGKSAYFNGTNAVATLSDAAWMDSSSITVEVRYKHNKNGAIGGRWRSGTDNLWLIGVDASNKFWASMNNTNNVIVSTTALTVGQTYTLALRCDGSTAKLFINGTEDKSVTYAGPNSGFADLEIGRAAGTTYYERYLDGFAFWTSAISATRLAAHHSAAVAAPTISGALSATLPKPTIALSGSYIARQTGTLSVTLPKPTVALSGTYTAPVNPSGTFDATMPLPVVSLSGDYLPHESGTLAVTLPVPTTSLAGGYTAPPHPMGTFDALLLVPTIALAGTYSGPYVTDTSNSRHGRRRLAYATATVTRPVAAPPDTLTLATKVDKALAYPAPTMVNGRPT